VSTATDNTADVFPDANIEQTTIYTTSSMPVDLNNDKDLQLHQDLLKSHSLGLVNPNGTVIRFVDFGPGNEAVMHRTQSLDYGVVLEGEIVMELDDGSTTTLKRGDVAVQRGTLHAWRNPHQTEWTRMLFVLQESKPLVVNGQTLREDLGGILA
jgi:quercetin dioxygenase-like cupin family protein